MTLPGNLSCRICRSKEHLARDCPQRAQPAAVSASAGFSGNINIFFMGDKPSTAAVSAAKQLADGAAMPQKNDRVVGSPQCLS